MSAEERRTLRSLRSLILDARAHDELEEDATRAILDELNARLRAARSSSSELFAKLARLAGSLGVALLIAGAMWFFAANWGGLPRPVKIALLSIWMLGSYVSGGILYLRTNQHRFAGQLLIIMGVLAFGLELALIGQAYNSQADAYPLFLVWLVPTILIFLEFGFFALAILAVVLANLALYFFIFPSGSPNASGHVLWAFFIPNLALTLAGESVRLRQRLGPMPFAIAWPIALAAFHVMTYWHLGGDLMTLPYNALYLAILGGACVVFIERRLDPALLGITLVFGWVHITLKYVEIIVYNYRYEVVLWLGSLFSLGLLAGQIVLIRIVTRWYEAARARQMAEPKGAGHGK